MQNNEHPEPFILGVDLGTNSMGWAMIRLDDGRPAGLIRCGVRVFEAGMEGDIASGSEESRNRKRQQMRSQRRQIERRARRRRKVFHLLQRYGLLPEERAASSEAIQDLLNALDRQIAASAWFASKGASGAFKRPDQVLPYILRACALDERLPHPHYVGRAFHHLGQRRGFLSNRRAPLKQEEDLGEVESGINELRTEIEESGARTLAEYFARLDPFERRIRERWTHRSMYQDEFGRIWQAQAAHYPEVFTPERRKELHRAMFCQRPLWFPENLVGTCELEPGERRAPKYSFPAQRFRLLQAVNNLKLEIDGAERGLTPEERTRLVEELELKGDLTFAEIRRKRKLFKLPKGAQFPVERDGGRKLPGNRTTAQFYEIFAQRWLEMSAGEHEQALLDVLSIQKDEALKRRAMNHWGLDEQHANRFVAISPEPGYFNLSLKAIGKMLPLLEAGAAYAEAHRQVYPDKSQKQASLSELPPLYSAADKHRLSRWAEKREVFPPGTVLPEPVGQIRNPALTRSLTELRRVVNAIVREHGKPEQIRIELARDLKNPKRARQTTSERMRDDEKAREKMKKILEEAGFAEPSEADIRKALLHEECRGLCAYTGKPIDLRHLFGPESQFDIEHIIPYERCFDDSFENLTLGYHEENRQVKGGRTPCEAYHADATRYEAILERVRRFHSRAAGEKLRRFQMTDTEATEFVRAFVERQLNDTRYASKLAAKYVAMLYGGLFDEEHRQRVRVISGELTDQLRSSWKLNAILSDGPASSGGGEVARSRGDHRHHAVDAVAIALTDDSTIQQLSHAAQSARGQGRELASLEGPWPDFVDSVRKQIGRIVVSYRVSRKVSGALHEETLYALVGSDGEAGCRVRKHLTALTKTEVEEIADPEVRRLVREKLESVGGEPKRVFSNRANLPCFVTRDGRRIPIKSVRIEKRLPTEALGHGRTTRHVTSDSNHHMEIYAEVKADGTEGRWDGEVVSMQEAYRRMRVGKPIIERSHGPQFQFRFALAAGEVIECDAQDGSRRLWVVRGMTSEKGSPRVFLVPLTDARQKTEIEASGLYWRRFLNPLRKLNARKVAIGPLGDVFDAHD